MRFRNIIDCLNHGLTLIYGFHRFYAHCIHGSFSIICIIRVIHLICDSDNWQLNNKHPSTSLFVLHLQLPPMRLHYIMGNAQPKACSLRPFFGGKERLQNFVFDIVWDAGAVVGDGNGDGVFCLMGSDR